MSRLHKSLLRDLWHLKGQVAAAALVVACGIAAFVTMLAAYHSLVSARASYYAEYRFADVFAQARRAPESLLGKLELVPGVAVAETRVISDVTLSIPGLAEPATGRLISVPDERLPALNGLHVAQGRYIHGHRPDEVVMSQTFARANNLRVGDRLGAVLNGRWRELTIVGLALSPEYVYEVGTAMIFPDNRRFGVLWMGRDALASALDMKGAFNDVSLSLARNAPVEDVIDAVDRILGPYGGIGAYGRDAQLSNHFLTDELGEIRTYATIIPGIFLTVSAFLVYMLLSRLVSVARGQIGSLKAFGYSDLRIGVHFLEFAVVIVGIGLLLGSVAGIFLGGQMVEIYRKYFHFPELRFQLPVSALVWTTAIALVSAASGSLTAVARVVRLPPAEAMRPEPPRTFQPGLLESSGLVNALGATSRVIARNLARRPWRALMSIAAISAAVATVVVGRFMFDTVDRLMALHFGAIQREDVTVTLHEPASGSAAAELRRLPGVLRAETFRSVPVRLRHEHREKRVALLGLPEDQDLRQVVDARGHRIGLPRDGLVMTLKLARILGVGVGDMVRVEQLDGRRLQFETPVAALSEEPLGISAYMDARALARILGEEGSISGAVMQTDSTLSAELYGALKRTPAVGGVAVRGAMLSSIEEVMNRTFIVMTIVMTSFAAVLVVGVVYNSARIALSERGNELASLRVLGFTRQEITALLLGEQALLTLLAIPVGFGLGALICRAMVPVFDREAFRLPYVLSSGTLGFAAVVTLLAAVLSGFLVVRRIGRLDLIAVLKSRE